ncbi:DUF1735 domain-containing protein [Niabella sp. CJ426]|uniref:DUF1735 domain-containing protein n=1 Tax=Niabella sp. CJ426 TaxID=3393740 RepID=UPI003D02634B
MNNKLSVAFLGIACSLTALFTGCKQDAIIGEKVPETGKVYFGLADSSGTKGINGVSTWAQDTVAKTVMIAAAIYRGGFTDLAPFTVKIQADNSAVDKLIGAGKLPANTVKLAAADYTLDELATIEYKDGVMKGMVLPKIKMSALSANQGKYIALGLSIASAEKFSINDARSKIVVYANVDSLMDAIIPPKNQILNDAWQVLKIANNDNVTATPAANGSFVFAGGSGGHIGIYQAVDVQAGRKYSFTFNVKGTGATDTWFEVYIGYGAPVTGADYNEGGVRMGLNTWTGCGKTAFDDLLSKVGCVGSGPIFTAPTTGKVYLVIRTGGTNLGTGGITASKFVFIRQ